MHMNLAMESVTNATDIIEVTVCSVAVTIYILYVLRSCHRMVKQLNSIIFDAHTLEKAMQIAMSSSSISSNTYTYSNSSSSPRSSPARKRFDNISLVDNPIVDIDDNRDRRFNRITSYNVTHTSNLTQSKTIVLDIGSLYTRYGFADDMKPSCIHTNDTSANVSVLDWNQLESIWSRIRNSSTAYHQENARNSLVLAWSPLNTLEDVDIVADIAFNKLNFSSIYLGTTPVFSLYGSGTATSGCSLHSGESMSYACLVAEGYAVTDSLSVSSRAGGSVTKNLQQLLLKYDQLRGSSDYSQLIRKFKEASCECDVNLGNAITNAAGNTTATSSATTATANDSSVLILPDGTKIQINEHERKRSPSRLFQPFATMPSGNHSVGGSSSSTDISLQEMVCNAIAKSTIRDDRLRYYQSIVVSGGNTMLKGFQDRLRYEINAMIEDGISIDVSSSDKANSDDVTWVGGSVIASSTTYTSHLISKDDYNEYGTSIINHRCQTVY